MSSIESFKIEVAVTEKYENRCAATFENKENRSNNRDINRLR